MECADRQRCAPQVFGAAANPGRRRGLRRGGQAGGGEAVRAEQRGRGRVHPGAAGDQAAGQAC